MGPKSGWGGVLGIGYVRPVQFLDHLAVIKSHWAPWLFKHAIFTKAYSMFAGALVVITVLGVSRHGICQMFYTSEISSYHTEITFPKTGENEQNVS